MNGQLLIVVLIGLAASIEDICQRRVSNWISVSALAAGLCCLVLTRGWQGLLSSLLGAAGGFSVFFIFYWLGGMGGGDVKLMAGLGAVVGVERVLAAALWTAVCGGVLAAAWVAALAIRGLCVQCGTRKHSDSFPYAPAIALGSWLALLSGV